MGHVHLKVSAIADTVAFYRDVLGFGLMAQLGAQAAFLAAGGYHHHLGANTWESAGASPPPAGTAALRHATIVLPDTSERDRVVDRLERAGHAAAESDGGPMALDPSGNALVLAVPSSCSTPRSGRARAAERRSRPRCPRPSAPPTGAARAPRPRLLGDREWRLLGEALAVRGQPVHGQEVDARPDPLLAESLLVLVPRRPGPLRVDADDVEVERVGVALVRPSGSMPSSSASAAS